MLNVFLIICAVMCITYLSVTKRSYLIGNIIAIPLAIFLPAYNIAGFLHSNGVVFSLEFSIADLIIGVLCLLILVGLIRYSGKRVENVFDGSWQLGWVVVNFIVVALAICGCTYLELKYIVLP